MSSAAKPLEDRIRERAYHIWEASGRPFGRDQEFWQQACELIATDHDKPVAEPARRQRKQAQPPRKRVGKASMPASSPAG